MNRSLLLIFLIFSNSTFANIDDVIKKLQPYFPDLSSKNISQSELDGFYQVLIINPQIDIFYVSIDGRYVIQGAVTDLELMANISTNPINSIRKKILNSISEEDKIVFKAENEQYIVHVFTDVDCPYCAKLHANMQGMNSLGITVKYLASPLEQLHPNAQSAMEKIWCAEDKAIAMHNYKTNRYLPDSPDCINPVKKQLAISKQLGVNGTPSIFFENGLNVPGFLEPDELLNSYLKTIAQ